MWLCALGAPALAGQQPARGPNVFERDAQIREQCSKSFTGEKSIYEEGTKLKADFQPDGQCRANSGGAISSHNATAIDGASGLEAKRKKFLEGSSNTRSLTTYDMQKEGACRMAYLGMKEVFDTMVSLHQETCEKIDAALREAQNCVQGKECEKPWREHAKAQNLRAESLHLRFGKALDYLDAASHVLDKAKKAYLADRNVLDDYFKKKEHRSLLTLAPSATALEEISGNTTLKASNGNSSTAMSGNLTEYYNLLRKQAAAPGSPATLALRDPTTLEDGDLIQEEVLAATALDHNVKGFKKKFRDEFNELYQVAKRLAQQSQALADQYAKNGSVDPEKKNDLTKYTAPASTVAGPLTNMMKGQNTPDPASAAHAISGSSRPLTDLATAGAVGAIAARSLGGSSQAAPAPSAAEPPAEAGTHGKKGAPAEVNKFDAQADGKTPGAFKPEGELPTLNKNKHDTTPAGTAEAGVFGGLSGDGSSRFLAGSKKDAKHGAPATAGATVDPGGGQLGDGMGNFSQNLEPKAVPRGGAAASSPGGEVANLLGQMKNLFNFDENAPVGGPAGAPALGMTSSGDASVPAPGSGEEPAAPATDDSGTPVAENAPGEQAPAAAGHDVHASEYGRVDTSLFARVRTRHHRCMERGLVLYGLRERVE